MLETPHVAVGAAIATKVVNPALAIPLSLGSHFILEKVPHWNPHIYTELKRDGKVSQKSIAVIVADVGLSLVLGSFIAYQMLPNTNLALTVLASSFAAVLPDVVEAPYFFLKNKSKILEKWVLFQKSLQVDVSILPGLTIQFFTVIAALWWIMG